MIICVNIYAFLILIKLSHGVHHTQSHEDNLEKTSTKGNQTEQDLQVGIAPAGLPNCMTESLCSELPAPCLSCSFNLTCEYGKVTPVNCSVVTSSKCSGSRELSKEFICRYCYQTEPWEHKCVESAGCSSVASPRAYYKTNCTVHDDIICLGKRTFNKNVLCNWTGGYRWSTALILSVTLGGFGADRFYLGHWQEGIGKLFSFGGLGVWTLIDVILISLRYLGPADGSLYI